MRVLMAIGVCAYLLPPHRFQQWPGDALEAVAFKLLREVDGLDEPTRASLVKLCQAFHSRVTAASGEFKTELGR